MKKPKFGSLADLASDVSVSRAIPPDSFLSVAIFELYHRKEGQLSDSLIPLQCIGRVSLPIQHLKVLPEPYTRLDVEEYGEALFEELGYKAGVQVVQEDLKLV
jgi:hypothetical protein